ncbi:Tn3 family transposase [Nonomuraea sp. NPDC005983]|uniref:Tn3 family transposase n=1 Tax=Nonomuraea sp. NPDC005983 TaxID=3155595 RepID=UPI0033BF9365
MLSWTRPRRDHDWSGSCRSSLSDRCELLPRIRNWHDLIFYRPDARTRYQHIDALFGDSTIDWGLIEKHWTDLLRTAISIREGRVSSVTLLRPSGHSQNQGSATYVHAA